MELLVCVQTLLKCIPTIIYTSPWLFIWKGETGAETTKTFFHLLWSAIDINKMMVLWIHFIDLTRINCSWTFSLYYTPKPLTLGPLEVIVVQKVYLKSQSHRQWKLEGAFFILSLFSQKSRFGLGCWPTQTFQVAIKNKTNFQSLHNKI
jgi:hypothetical protein